MKTITLFAITFLLSTSAFAQNEKLPPSLVNFDAFLALAQEVQEHRKDRVLPLKEWLKMSQETNTIILDTRSKAMYDAKHIKGAVHLNFADFNMESLYRIAPNKETRILIYCNNNISKNPIFFASKVYIPRTPKETKRTLALNVPTYINLYGYGYKNVYELKDLVNPAAYPELQLEGTMVPKKKN